MSNNSSDIIIGTIKPSDYDWQESAPAAPTWSVDNNAYTLPETVTTADSWSSQALSQNNNIKIVKKYLNPFTSATGATSGSGYSADVMYFDGLGAPLQKVDINFTAALDLVTPFEQRCLQVGEMREYLPYTVPGSAICKLRPTALADQKAYYSKLFAQNGEDAKAYVRYKTEVSPRATILETTRPGQDVSQSSTCSVTVNADDDVNTVRKFQYTPYNDTVSIAGYYDWNTVLVKTAETNEDGMITETFRNSRGLVILTRQRHRETPGVLADTYYLYDLWDRPICVIMPAADFEMFDATEFIFGSYEGCFFYRYNTAGRMKAKKIPTKEWEYFVYDAAGRVLFSQDGNMRKHTSIWMHYQYDGLGRMTSSEKVFLDAAETCDTLQAKVDTKVAVDCSNCVPMTQCGYDMPMAYKTKYIAFETGRWLRIFSSATDEWSTAVALDTEGVMFDSYGKVKRIFTCEIQSSSQGKSVVYYVPKGYTHLTDAVIKKDPKNCAYVSDKPSKPTAELIKGFYHRTTEIVDLLYKGAPEWSKYVPRDGFCTKEDLSLRTQGLKTYERIYVLDEVNYTDRYFYYDKHGRVIQIVTKNPINIDSRCSMKYDFAGKLVASEECNWGDTKLTTYIYDNRGRLTSQKTTLNGTSVTTAFIYNDLGQLRRCTFTVPDNNRVNVGYSYDIQGRTNRISYPVFSETLTYTPGGNISHVRAGVRNKFTNYSYTYDGLGRLVDETSVQGTTPMATYTMTYDRNGDLKSYIRHKPKSGKYIVQNYTYNDHFQYSYDKGCILYEVTRSGARASDAVVGMRNGKFKMKYDANGNLVFNGDKNCEIEYNSLNLNHVTTNLNDNTAVITTWLSDGTRLRSLRCVDLNNITERFYFGSLIYDVERGEVSTDFPGGRIVSSANGMPSYIKNTTPAEPMVQILGRNHLGSVCFVQNTANDTEHSSFYNIYEPFGLLDLDFSTIYNGPYSSPDDLLSDVRNRFQFNGKENVSPAPDKLMLDYGAREYDPVLARWTTTDPLADKYVNISPYAFCANNPVYYVDPNGKEIYITVYDSGKRQHNIKYTPNMSYDGTNSFIKAMIGILNDSYANGADRMIDKLVGSSSKYNILNEFVNGGRGGTQRHKRGDNYEVDFLLGGVMNEEYHYKRIETLNHELAHGLQSEYGQYGANFFNEVEAGVFGIGVAMNYSISRGDYNSGFSFYVGIDSEYGDKYDDAMKNLVYNGYSKENMTAAISNFTHSIPYNSGMYNSYGVKPDVKPLRPLLSKYYYIYPGYLTN